MRVSAEAMNAALSDFRALEYQTQTASAYEAFLAAKWIEAHESPAKPTFSNVGGAVPALFGLLPDHQLGRLAPFKYDWKTLADTGRKTVWNNNSRGGRKRSLLLFVDGDIRNGLKSGAAQLLGALLPADRPSWRSLAAVVLHDHEFQATDSWDTARQQLLTALNITSDELDAITLDTDLEVDLLGEPQWSYDMLSESLRPEEAVVVQAPGAPTVTAANAADAAVVSIMVDNRVERMLRLALMAYQSILLVGPPGTGKGTLLRWMLSDVAQTPERYGFPTGFRTDSLWRTPDESWTAFELIGGLAPDMGGALSWSPGALLNAIEEDRWLILDETNRGDMDKIMGPLLTWLSRQEVEIGRTAPHGGKPILIGWTAHRASESSSDETQQRYLAGRDWRLLGTYNPQDAQRVFRFGQALSRRFVIIPVPAVRPGQFAQLLATAAPGLPEQATEAIGSLYAAHLADPLTALGPAVFLSMARYIEAGLPVSADVARPPVTVEERLGDDAEPAAGMDNAVLQELLAEAYVLGSGRYLAGFEDRTFDALGLRIVDDEMALTAEQWTWLTTQRDILS